MCGICGIIGGLGDRTEPTVRAMMQAMVHRGPDDEGYEARPFGSDESGAAATFGFRRLAILDLTPTGHQPMTDERTGNCLVYNGEIYNFRDIRTRLAAKGVRFRSTGDTEVLLQALSHWGEAAIDELDGMFAFAFYEARSRRVLLARDHLGIKPLYVARLPRAVVFASEVRAILASGLVPSDLDPAGIASFFAYGATQDPLTVHKAIRSFEAGSFQWHGAELVEGRAPSPGRRWWRFPAIAAQQVSETALIDRIENVLADSVRNQCIADVPLVIFLSGGLDSAAIAALAKRCSEEVLTFTVGNATSEAEDESMQARETAEILRSRHFETIVDEEWVQSEWREWRLGSDRPSIDGLNTMLVSNAVKAAGNSVALSGLGADELFGGYWTFDEVRRLRRLVGPMALIPRALRGVLVSQLANLAPAGRRARLVELFGHGTSYLDFALLTHRVHGDKALHALGFNRRSLGLSEHWLPHEAYDRFTNLNQDLFHTVSQVETLLYMGNTMLRDTDVNSMRCSLETRVPFLGKRVVELVGSIPGRVQLPPGPARKYLLRKLTSRLLPEKVLGRPKRGFLLPIGRWMDGPLRHQCQGSLASLAASTVVRAAGVQDIWTANSNQIGHVAQSRKLSLVVLGSYLETVRPITA